MEVHRCIQSAGDIDMAKILLFISSLTNSTSSLQDIAARRYVKCQTVFLMPFLRFCQSFPHIPVKTCVKLRRIFSTEIEFSSTHLQLSAKLRKHARDRCYQFAVVLDLVEHTVWK